MTKEQADRFRDEMKKLELDTFQLSNGWGNWITSEWEGRRLSLLGSVNLSPRFKADVEELRRLLRETLEDWRVNTLRKVEARRQQLLDAVTVVAADDVFGEANQ